MCLECTKEMPLEAGIPLAGRICDIIIKLKVPTCMNYYLCIYKSNVKEYYSCNEFVAGKSWKGITK